MLRFAAAFATVVGLLLGPSAAAGKVTKETFNQIEKSAGGPRETSRQTVPTTILGLYYLRFRLAYECVKLGGSSTRRLEASVRLSPGGAGW